MKLSEQTWSYLRSCGALSTQPSHAVLPPSPCSYDNEQRLRIQWCLLSITLKLNPSFESCCFSPWATTQGRQQLNSQAHLWFFIKTLSYPSALPAFSTSLFAFFFPFCRNSASSLPLWDPALRSFFSYLIWIAILLFFLFTNQFLSSLL